MRIDITFGFSVIYYFSVTFFLLCIRIICSLNSGSWSLEFFLVLANHRCELIGFESR